MEETIPEDVRETASGLVANYGFDLALLEGAICSALVLERERAAKLVEQGVWVNPYVRQHDPQYVASAIRSGV